MLNAEGNQLRVQHQYKFLAVEHVETGTYESHDAFPLPLDVLNEFEGRDTSPVVLEDGSPALTIVRFQDHAIPQVREYTVPKLEDLAAFPSLPTSWSTNPPDLLSALAAASETTAIDSTRYALNCIQLQGEPGEIVATDGRQLLVQSGYHFPWPDNVIVHRAPILGCRDLPHDEPIEVGRTDTHVVFRMGDWTLFLEIYAEGRFPAVADVLPDSYASVARLQLDPKDATFLASTLDHLPGGEVLHAPATLDLNGCIAVRAQNPDQTQTTELVLSRSGYTGTPIRVNSGRSYLIRAIRLGFNELEITGVDLPVVCRAKNRVYGWQPLNKESVIEPTNDAVRIESSTTNPCPASRSDAKHQGERPVNRKTTSINTPNAKAIDAPDNGHVAPDGRDVTDAHARTGISGPTSLSALIQESEALLVVIGDVRLRTKRLIAGLRRHKKQGRLMATTLAALKQLKLQEVSE